MALSNITLSTGEEEKCFKVMEEELLKEDKKFWELILDDKEKVKKQLIKIYECDFMRHNKLFSAYLDQLPERIGDERLRIIVSDFRHNQL